MLKAIGQDPVITGLQKDAYLNRLEKVCAEFESIFITYMLKSMRKTIGEDSPLGDSNEMKIIKSMFDENLALGISKSGGMGLGKMIFERLKDENPGSLPSPEEEQGNMEREDGNNRPLIHKVVKNDLY
jgi:flagellar protein FlgJ